MLSEQSGHTGRILLSGSFNPWFRFCVCVSYCCFCLSVLFYFVSLLLVCIFPVFLRLCVLTPPVRLHFSCLRSFPKILHQCLCLPTSRPAEGPSSSSSPYHHIFFVFVPKKQWIWNGLITMHQWLFFRLSGSGLSFCSLVRFCLLWSLKEQGPLS